MPANVGEMFYTGAVPWHGQGVSLAQPATLDEALKVGGLNWRVDEVDLMTAEDPPSPVDRRKALVRSDIPAGHDNRVLGVAHRGFTPIQNAATAARDYFQAMMLELDKVGESFVVMSKCQCTADQVDSILKALIPNPTKPRNADRNPGLMRAWETRSEAAAAARRHIAELRLSGKGQDLAGSEGTLWGVLNAVLEYVDHHHKTDQSRISYALFGDGMDLKARAFQVIRQEAEKAA